MNNIAIIGSGNFGANAALYLAEENVGHITLIDKKDGYAAGKALDLMEAAPIRRYDNWICASNDISAITGAQVVVVAAGKRRKPGMKREELLPTNLEIIRPILEAIKACAPEAIVVIQPQPVDLLTLAAIREFDFDPRRIIGLSSMLESARLRFFMAQTLGVSPLDTSAMVIGRHGQDMIPLIQYASVSGIPLVDLMAQEQIEQIIERTRRAGDEIVDLLQIGPAYYAPATCLVELVAAIMGDQQRFLPASVLAQGAYGIQDVCIGLPVLFGKRGVEKIVEIDITEEQRGLLERAAAFVKTLANKTEGMA